MRYTIATCMILFGIILAAGVQAEEIRDIVFPVDGEVFFKDDFDDARSGGRTHHATDLIGDKMTPLISAVDGVVTFLPETEPSWGWGVWIRDDEGYEYVYLHVNNDTPGTDDGQGGIEWAFAPEVRKGARVTRGQFIGYMGDSGNAENIGSHLHFEIHRPDGTPMNPYLSLLAAQSGFTGSDDSTQVQSAYDPDAVRDEAVTISDDRALSTIVIRPCQEHALMRTSSSSAVYYCGRDGKRYAFPTDRVFYSWYENFTNVQVITAEQLSATPLGGLVTYRPGTKLVKIQSDPKVYAVDSSGVLRWITSADVAQRLYGANWGSMIDDVDVSFFFSYTMGEPIY